MPVHIEHATAGRKVGWPGLVGLLLIPLLIAGGFVWATWDNTQRLDRVDAAIVNNDKPVTIKGQVVPLGRQLSAGLMKDVPEPTSGQSAEEAPKNYNWTLSSDADAAEGLRSGRYTAVVTIPENFSAAATSYGGDDPAKARQATIDVQVSAVTQIVDPALSQAIVAAATGALNSQLTTTYLDNIYVGFNQLNKQFGTVADAAGKLDDGAQQLAGGIGDTHQGAKDLAGGLQDLSGGAGELATGVKGLSTGTGDLAAGLKDLATGGKALSTGTQGLADGMRKLADGSGGLQSGTADLASGLQKLKSGSKDLPSQVALLDKGASGLAGGVGSLSDGAGRLADGAAQLDRNLPALASGSTQVATGASGLAAGLDTYRNAVAGLPTAITCQAAGITDPASCRAFEAGVSAASKAAVQGLEQPGPRNQPSLIVGAAALSKGAGQLASGVNGTAQQPGLVAGVAGLATGSAKLSDGADALAAGATQLANGTGQLSKGVPALVKGIAGAADGAQQLADGAAPLVKGISDAADGAERLASGVPGLAKGMADAADGAKKLADGADQLSFGADGLAKGTAGTADGAGQLADGLGKLATGATGLANGTQALHRGLVKGAGQVPTYSAAERKNLSEVVAAPVTTGDQQASIFSDVSAAAFLAVVALWLGALATYLVVRAVSARTLSSMRPSWLLALQALAPGWAMSVLQAIGLTIITGHLLDLSPGRFAGVLGLSLLAGLTFVALNHALVAAFGGAGRFISVVLVVLTAAGSLLSAVPGFFDVVRPLLPLSPALEGIKAVAGGGTGAGRQVGLLAAWLLVSVTVSVMATARKRQTTADALVRGSY